LVPQLEQFIDILGSTRLRIKHARRVLGSP